LRTGRRVIEEMSDEFSDSDGEARVNYEERANTAEERDKERVTTAERSDK